MNTLHNDVLRWGFDKGIITRSEYQVRRQFEKMREEFNEVELALNNYFAVPVEHEQEARFELMKEFGDLEVTALMTTACLGIDLEVCLQMAHDKITKRTGKVVDGQFVKDD